MYTDTRRMLLLAAAVAAAEYCEHRHGERCYPAPPAEFEEACAALGQPEEESRLRPAQPASARVFDAFFDEHFECWAHTAVVAPYMGALARAGLVRHEALAPAGVADTDALRACGALCLDATHLGGCRGFLLEALNCTLLSAAEETSTPPVLGLQNSLQACARPDPGGPSFCVLWGAHLGGAERFEEPGWRQRRGRLPRPPPPPPPPSPPPPPLAPFGFSAASLWDRLVRHLPSKALVADSVLVASIVAAAIAAVRCIRGKTKRSPRLKHARVADARTMV